jgi:hypothetical protein
MGDRIGSSWPTDGERLMISTGISSTSWKRRASTGTRSSSFLRASSAGEESTSDGDRPTGECDSTSSHSHPADDESVCASGWPLDEGDRGPLYELLLEEVMGKVPDAERIIDGSVLWGDVVREEPEKDAEKVEKRDESRGRGGGAAAAAPEVSVWPRVRCVGLSNAAGLLEPLSGRSNRMGERSSSWTWIESG